jgi:hypothetical protein
MVKQIAAAWLAQSMPPEGLARDYARDPAEGAQDNLPQAYRKITPEGAGFGVPGHMERPRPRSWGPPAGGAGMPQVWQAPYKEAEWFGESPPQ